MLLELQIHRGALQQHAALLDAQAELLALHTDELKGLTDASETVAQVLTTHRLQLEKLSNRGGNRKPMNGAVN